MRALPGERYRFDEAHHALRGRRAVYRLGDLIEVRLAEADRITGALAFEPAQPPSPEGRPRPAAKARRARGASRRP